MMKQVSLDASVGKQVKEIVYCACGPLAITFSDDTFVLLAPTQSYGDLSIEEPHYDPFDFNVEGAIRAGIISREEWDELHKKRTEERERSKRQWEFQEFHRLQRQFQQLEGKPSE